MLKRLEQVALSIGRSPATTSRAVTGVFVTIAVFAGIFQSGDLEGGNLQSDVLSTTERNSAAIGGTPKTQTGTEVSSAAQKCSTQSKEAEKLIEKFEYNFNGVLPGAGFMLLENPAAIDDNKSTLISNVLKKYANLKYCIDPNAFLNIYKDEDVLTTTSAIDAFLESNSEISSVYGLDASQASMNANTDIKETREHLSDIIDRAVEAAIELDRQTQIRISNTTTATANQIAKINGERLNEIITTGHETSSKLNTLQAIQASFISGTPAEKKTIEDLDSQDIYINFPDTPTFVQKSLESFDARVRFGLLNLLDPSDAYVFLNARYPKETALYIAATAFVDPFQPDEVYNLENMAAKISGGTKWQYAICAAPQACFLEP